MCFRFGMMGGFGMIIPLLLIALIIYVVFRLSQNSHKNHSYQMGENEAIDILNRRFANGEISEEEYIQKKKMLGIK